MPQNANNAVPYGVLVELLSLQQRVLRTTATIKTTISQLFYIASHASVFERFLICLSRKRRQTTTKMANTGRIPLWLVGLAAGISRIPTNFGTTTPPRDELGLARLFNQISPIGKGQIIGFATILDIAVNRDDLLANADSFQVGSTECHRTADNKKLECSLVDFCPSDDTACDGTLKFLADWEERDVTTCFSSTMADSSSRSDNQQSWCGTFGFDENGDVERCSFVGTFEDQQASFRCSICTTTPGGDVGYRLEKENPGKSMATEKLCTAIPADRQDFVNALVRPPKGCGP